MGLAGFSPESGADGGGGDICRKREAAEVTGG